MKKTLFMLVATAASVMGASLNTSFVVDSTTTTPITLSGMSGSFSLVATLNLDYFVSYVSAGASNSHETGYTAFSITASGDKNLGFCFNTLSDNNVYLGATTVTASNDRLTYVNVNDGRNFWKDYSTIDGTDAKPVQVNNQINWNNVTGAALTMVHNDKSNSQVYLTVAYTDGTTYTLAGTQSDLKWSGGIGAISDLRLNTNIVNYVEVYSGALSSAEVLTHATQLVPEPTTATLSLLALCGLAARRRRR